MGWPTLGLGFGPWSHRCIVGQIVERLTSWNWQTRMLEKKLINQVYGIRSTLVHGSSLATDQLALWRDREKWWTFEQVVRCSRPL